MTTAVLSEAQHMLTLSLLTGGQNETLLHCIQVGSPYGTVLNAQGRAVHTYLKQNTRFFLVVTPSFMLMCIHHCLMK